MLRIGLSVTVIGLASCAEYVPTADAVREAIRARAASTPTVASAPAAPAVAAVTGRDTVHVNQVGFHPAADKAAIVIAPAGQRAAVIDAAGNIVFEADLAEPSFWAPADQRVQRFDFSSLRDPGRYEIVVDGQRRSPAFVIDSTVLETVATAALKAFYFNRAGTAISRERGNTWSRAAGHPDTRVLVHESAASAARPAGTMIASPGGWYDAGDYNKYVVNGSFATYALLAAFEDYRSAFESLQTNIPESTNTIPDVLDEILWNLEWLLTMQDPNDGGVYHKLTSKRFSGYIMPAQDELPRYVVQKSTAAALDFAAVTALASRLFRDMDRNRAQRFEAAATAAWRWSLANPNVLYEQPDDIVTGTYAPPRERLIDERLWAGTELMLTTGNRSYLDGLALEQTGATVPSWSQVAPLAWLSLLRSPVAPADLRAIARGQVLRVADRLVEVAAQGYGVTVSNARDFGWGSNSTVALHAVMLSYAFAESGDARYLAGASADLDYLLGRNPLGRSFVTGLGARTPLNIHHRPSIADGIAAPVPGLLVGGPHAGQQDRDDCGGRYPSDLPALSYLDEICSYATNEVAINWNASLVWAAMLTQRGLDRTRPGPGATPPRQR